MKPLEAWMPASKNGMTSYQSLRDIEKKKLLLVHRLFSLIFKGYEFSFSITSVRLLNNRVFWRSLG